MVRWTNVAIVRWEDEGTSRARSSTRARYGETAFVMALSGGPHEDGRHGCSARRADVAIVRFKRTS